jgi:hypothetical protein
MSEENNIQVVPLPPVKVAFIIDGFVVDVIHTDERLGAIFTSNPLIKDVTAEEGGQMAWLDDDYDPETDTFSRDGVAPTVQSGDDMPPIKIAFILDNKVVDVFHTDERMAAILLNDPIIKNVTGEDGVAITQYGDIYNSETDSFEPPAQEFRRPPQTNTYEGWVMDEELGHLVPPIPYPQDGKVYAWDFGVNNWVEDTPMEPNSFEGWVMDEELGNLVPPIPYPQDGKRYVWDNQTQNWVEG